MIGSPLRYTPAVEKPETDEAETTQGMIDALRDIAKSTYKDSGHAWRGVHAKSHGLLRAELQIAQGLPEHLAQGLFAKPGSYPVVMRFSTSPGDVLDDDISTPRGVAIKVIGVEGTDSRDRKATRRRISSWSTVRLLRRRAQRNSWAI